MPDIRCTITATVPFDVEFSSADDLALKQRAEFMQRAQDKIVETAIPAVDLDDPAEAETSMRCLNLVAADCDVRGYVIPVEDRNSAFRLLEAGLLDQSRDAIIQRWGVDNE